MGGMMMGECEKKKNYFTLFKYIINISKEDMEDYNWTIFTHAMDFFKKNTSLKKLIPKHFFTSLLNNLLIEDLVNLGNLLLIEFMKL
jgi:hypothetical protein